MNFAFNIWPYIRFSLALLILSVWLLIVQNVLKNPSMPIKLADTTQGITDQSISKMSALLFRLSCLHDSLIPVINSPS